MQIVYEQCNAGDVHPLHARTLVDESLRLDVDQTRTSIVITGDFAASVRARLPPDQAAHFAVERAYGYVAGKTITDPTTDTTDIVLPVAVLQQPDDHQAALVRGLVAHELAHVAINQRDGEVIDAHRRLRAPTNSHLAFMLGLAAKAIDEVRVERWLHRRKLRVRRTPTEEILAAVQDVRAELVAAIVADNADDDVWTLYLTIFSLFRDLVNLLATYAAEELEAGPGQRPSGAVWDHFAGPHHARLVATLVEVPTAEHQVRLPDLDVFVRDTADVLARWFSSLGFTAEDQPAGSLVAFYIEQRAADDAELWLREQR